MDTILHETGNMRMKCQFVGVIKLIHVCENASWDRVPFKHTRHAGHKIGIVVMRRKTETAVLRAVSS